jgi:APA family basic amino acid/polyamine antiporter
VNWARLFIWLAIGLVIYFTYSRHHSKVQALNLAGATQPKPQPTMAD